MSVVEPKAIEKRMLRHGLSQLRQILCAGRSLKNACQGLCGSDETRAAWHERRNWPSVAQGLVRDDREASIRAKKHRNLVCIPVRRGRLVQAQDNNAGHGIGHCCRSTG
jgi:hypothetical protein